MTAPGLGAAHQRARLIVLARDGWRCHWCGGPATEADHLLERVRGGTSIPSNLVASCKSCNARRGNALAQTRRRRGHRLPFFANGFPP